MSAGEIRAPVASTDAPDRPTPRLPSRRSGWRLSFTLLAITFLTTLITGVAFEAGARRIENLGLLDLIGDPATLLLGLPYALGLLGILGCHEMGHYVACRRYGIDATPPYFLPSPPAMLFGTFGAFIRIRAPITDRKALFDVGVAGPLAGMAVAVPVMIAGILGSTWQPDIPEAGGLYLGDCLAIRILSSWLVPPPPEAEGYVLAFGSVAMAGWVGFLATALNLLPVGQLDGGHIAYAVSPRLHRWLSRLCMVCFVILGLVINESWLFWATVLVFLSPRHPALVDEHRRLAPGRIVLAAAAAVVLILCFIPNPIRLTS